jgi:hypothetical protein
MLRHIPRPQEEYRLPSRSADGVSIRSLDRDLNSPKSRYDAIDSYDDVAKFLDAERLWDHLDVIDYDSYWHEQSESHQKRQQRAQDLLEEFTQLMSPSSAVKPRHGANDTDLADIRDLQHQFERELRLVIGEFEDDNDKDYRTRHDRSKLMGEDEMTNQVMEEIRRLSAVNAGPNRSERAEEVKLEAAGDGAIEPADTNMHSGMKKIHQNFIADLTAVKKSYETFLRDVTIREVDINSANILDLYDELAGIIQREMQRLQKECVELKEDSALVEMKTLSTNGRSYSNEAGDAVECEKLRQELEKQRLRYERELEASSSNILELENTLEEYKVFLRDNGFDVDGMECDESDLATDDNDDG